MRPTSKIVIDWLWRLILPVIPWLLIHASFVAVDVGWPFAQTLLRASLFSALVTAPIAWIPLLHAMLALVGVPPIWRFTISIPVVLVGGFFFLLPAIGAAGMMSSRGV